MISASPTERFAMAFTDALLGEFDHEMKTTRSLLERVPMDKAEWKPHTKSTSLGGLASHLAQLAGYGALVAGQNEVDMAPRTAPGFKPVQFTTRDELLSAFDANAAKSREQIAKLPESKLGDTWTLRNGDHVIFSLPRAAVFRSFLMNHMVHHRGQLSVYLRLNDVPLPSIYGPTADT
jgi:uncharacterized damage-inducible protein DinB